jgi:hypothetical protein
MPVIQPIPNPTERYPGFMSSWVYGDGAGLTLPPSEDFDMAEAIGLLDDLAEVTGPLGSDLFVTYPEPSLSDE